ncbi:MAG: hypothetical protein KME26_02245 [Oscillatoria princeps RMCB-10]|nr:hypothetical protein [Oscillatoria princeps RMCB-10]
MRTRCTGSGVACATGILRGTVQIKKGQRSVERKPAELMENTNPKISPLR